MRKLLIFSLLWALFLIAQPAFPGTPGGLQILMLRPAVDEQRFQTAITAFFSRYSPDDGMECLDTLLNIDSVTTETSIKNVVAENIIKATTSKTEHKALAKKLGAYRDRAHDHGYDAALTYRNEGDQLVFYAVGSFADVPARVSKLPITALQDNARVDEAICKALVHIPVNAEP